jgi:thioredoxin 1
MKTLFGIFFVFFIVVGCKSGQTESNQEKGEKSMMENASASDGQDKATVKADTMVQNVKTANKGIKVTFVELGSVNCIPCKMMKSVMEAIEKEYGDQVQVVFHDVWTAEGKEYGIKYQIRGIPTQVFLDKDGKEYSRHMGFFPKDEVVKVLKMGGVK